MSTHAGKGDTPRPVDPAKYGENYDRIFRKTRTVQVPAKNQLGETVAHAEIEERIPAPDAARRVELEMVRDMAFNSKWPKPRFEWEKIRKQ